MRRVSEVTTKTTTTYNYQDNIYHGFCVDISTDGDTIEAFLYHRDYGIKSLMWGGMLTKDQTAESFKDLVFANIPDYIKLYLDEYMD